MKIDTDNFKIAGTAKIERNDNGVAISYDDGTLICTNSVRTTGQNAEAWGTVFMSTLEMTYPKEFIETPIVVPQICVSSNVFWAGLGSYGSQSTSKTTIRAISCTNYTNHDITYGYIAIGRWK